jgi:hypothetical protein
VLISTHPFRAFAYIVGWPSFQVGQGVFGFMSKDVYLNIVLVNQRDELDLLYQYSSYIKFTTMSTATSHAKLWTE